MLTLEQSTLQETLGIASLYFDVEMIDAAVVHSAVREAVSSMNRRYKPEFVPKEQDVCDLLCGFVDEARSQQSRANADIVTPDKFSRERLMKLKIN